MSAKRKKSHEIGPLNPFGRGQRRQCYLTADREHCVKFYRDLGGLPPETKPKIRMDIVLGRHMRVLNINYREWKYHQKLRERLPADLAAVFPTYSEPVLCDEKGWGILEELIVNADGHPARLLLDEFEDMGDTALALRIHAEARALLRRLALHSVCFFDFGNILLQWTGPSTFRLRVADFEPTCRAFVPGLTHIPFYVRCKSRRRARRYLAVLQNTLVAKGCDPDTFREPLPDHWLSHLPGTQPVLRLARRAGLF